MPSIEQQAAKGAAWTIGAGMGSRLLGVIATLLLTHYIAPDDYGAVIIASVLVVTTSSFSSFGLSQYLVVQRDLKQDETFHVSLFHLFGTLTALTLLVTFRDPVTAWLQTPSAVVYLPGLCLAIAIERIAVLPERMMSRRLEFRKIALSRAAADTTYAAAAIGFAVMGFSGMSIVYAHICRVLLLVSILYRFVSIKDLLTPCRLSWKIIRRIFWFGGPLSVDELSHFASRQWDNLLMGRFFGEAVTGNYNLAYNLADIPASHVGEHIGDVLLPSFSKMDGDRRRWALQRATGFLAIIVFPMAIGLAVVAPTLAETILDPKYDMVGPMITLLAGLSIVRPVGWTMGSYLQSLSQTRMLMVLGIIRLVILVAALFALKPLGPYWACGAAGLAYSIHAFGAMWMVKRVDGIGFGQILVQLWPPLVACVPMVGAVLAVRYMLTNGGWPVGWLMLACEILAGALTYVLAMRVMSPVLFENVLSQLKGMINRRGSESDDS